METKPFKTHKEILKHLLSGGMVYHKDSGSHAMYLHAGEDFMECSCSSGGTPSPEYFPLVSDRAHNFFYVVHGD